LQVVALAEKYNVDVDVMETLGRFIGTYERDPNMGVVTKEGNTLHLVSLIFSCFFTLGLSWTGLIVVSPLLV
jgi:hypothetical protein